LEHVLKTFYKRAITKLVGSVATGGVQLMKNIPATIREATELEEERRQQAVDVTFGVVLKIEVVVRNQSLSYALDILNDGGAYQKQ